MSGSMNLCIDSVACEDIAKAMGARASLESPRLDEQLVGISGGTFRNLCDSALDRIACARNGENAVWVGTKELWTIEFIPVLAAAYPEARFVVTQRDPRVMIASLAISNDVCDQESRGVSLWTRDDLFGVSLRGRVAEHLG